MQKMGGLRQLNTCLTPPPGSRTLVLLAALALVAGQLACVTTGDSRQTSSNGSPASDILIPAAAQNTSPEQLGEESPSSIKGNQMHEAHLLAGNECGDCHDPDCPLEHEESIEACYCCHEQTVEAEVWEHHCLTCHHFTYSDEEAANPLKVVELCQDCHVSEEASETIYAFIHPDELHNIACQRCHNPHESSQAAASQFCVECHPELVGIKHPTVGTTTCEQCHNPHLGGRTGFELCSGCHEPNELALVHMIPAHPKDCLACHSPHFNETEILGTSCLGCHDGLYYAGGENQPREHKDCENCHWVSDFQYKSDHVCGECHTSQGWVVENLDLPVQHRNCLTCHHPHTWRAPFELNCISCHDLDGVLEHNLEFHDLTCETCHDPHLIQGMPKSGNCAGCHGLEIPTFTADSPREHVECHNCHLDWQKGAVDFVFKGAEETCVKCHTKPHAKHEHDWDNLPAAHRRCNVCHPAHDFPHVQPSSASCHNCHADLVKTGGIAEHNDCFNCHGHNHTVAFMGQQTTCIPCHSEAAFHGRGGVKEDCLSCHTGHNFLADPQACADCHKEIELQAAALGKQDCGICHSNHNWHPDSELCIICHANVNDAHETAEYKTCNDCHVPHDFGIRLTQ